MYKYLNVQYLNVYDLGISTPIVYDLGISTPIVFANIEMCSVILIY